MYLIVGIDPGLHVGYAAIDLNGKLVAAGVVKQKNPDDIVAIISKIGIPLVVASDVRKAPAFVKDVGRKFSAKVNSPSRNMTKEDKQIIAKSIMNHHIRDAYAAAIKAYRRYSNRFHRIDSVYPDKNEEYKKMIIEGKAVGKVAKRI